ncbi:hypothetical protein HNR73_007604 [Phytomonospora endophytica]|uniref:Uncharacterized protein n=1 Tax=Phytomonospora endophytica TaxID=714109 RepID=A0A841FUM2_9ACTN|nr:hypothetical protein [Phytomonospora endophytica]
MRDVVGVWRLLAIVAALTLVATVAGWVAGS